MEGNTIELVDPSKLDYETLQKTWDTGAPRESPRFMTIYELTAVIGLRAQQLANNAPTALDIPPEALRGLKPRDLALRELREGVLPFLLCRTMPNGRREYWRLEELILPAALE